MPMTPVPLSYPAEWLLDLYNHGVLSANDVRDWRPEKPTPILTGNERKVNWEWPTLYFSVAALAGMILYLAIR